MSTRSTIALLQKDGSIKSIYCHSDGYPAGVGQILRNHYADQSKIEELLSFGDLSVLGARIGNEQDLNAPILRKCIFYGRDRGEEEINALIHRDLPSWLSEYGGCSYAYLFTSAGWRTFTHQFEVRKRDPLDAGPNVYQAVWLNGDGVRITSPHRLI